MTSHGKRLRLVGARSAAVCQAHNGPLADAGANMIQALLNLWKSSVITLMAIQFVSYGLKRPRTLEHQVLTYMLAGISHLGTTLPAMPYSALGTLSE